ncbi:MAG: HD domain-containing phosphohydrolase [Pseudomonadota bacterium]
METHPDSAGLLDFIKSFTAAVGNMQLFFQDHPQVSAMVDQAGNALQSITAKQGSLTLFRVGQTLVANGKALKGGSPAARKLVQILDGSGLESLTFEQGLTQEELVEFIRALASRQQTTLRSSGHIFLGKISLQKPPGPGPGQQTILDLSYPVSGPPRQEPPGLPGMDELKGVFQELNSGKPQVQDLIRSVNQFIDGFILTIHPMEYLGSIKHHDEYTFVHAVNVFVLTMAQAQYLGFKGRQLHDIGVAAVLHDVGKLFIADGIINKPGSLTDEERAIMQTHSMLGSRYLMNVTGLSRLAAICAMDHHIRFNGSGYPAIGKWKPCLVSQMIAISDAFDAMRSRRPYQEPKPQSIVIDILRKESGTAFNPVLVQNFLKLLGIALVTPVLGFQPTAASPPPTAP